MPTDAEALNRLNLLWRPFRASGFSYARLMAAPEGRRREIEAVVRRRLASR